MAEHSAIEWTDATWNPITGCSVVSPGCTNCYAMRLAGTRLRNHPSRAGLTTMSKSSPVWNGEVRLNEQWLEQPLRWRKPRRIFVCAHGDMFHESVPDEWIDRVFAVMALAPQHTFQVLTKRPERMRAYITEQWQPAPAHRIEYLGLTAIDVPAEMQGETREDQVRRACEPILETMGLVDTANDALWTADGDCKAMQWKWPLPNVWLGVSVEDQRRADERIPLLLATPAAVRFLSVEPMLEPIDLVGWGKSAAIRATVEESRSWTDWHWPDWVPERNRGLIADFWRTEWGRGPAAWQRDNHAQKMPATGERIGGTAVLNGRWFDLVREHDPRAIVRGRYIHHWNNIGSILTDDGRTVGCSGPQGTNWLVRRHKLHWVICGGESGLSARDMHPQWARCLRDQCGVAGVPFFMKQMARKTPIPDDLMVRQWPGDCGHG